MMIQELISLFEAQKLVQVDLIFDLANHLDAVGADKEKLNTALVNRLATRLGEVRLPYEGLSSVEKSSISLSDIGRSGTSRRSAGFNSAPISRRRSADAEKLRDRQGPLAQILRDTLVGYNYIHYAPPGAQILRTNSVIRPRPRFRRYARIAPNLAADGGVRHRLAVERRRPSGRIAERAALCPGGSRAELPDPQREQALIWVDLVPQMILNAKIPRWWNVTPAQMHWVAMHVRYGETAVAEAALNPARRKLVLQHLDHQAPPTRVKRLSTCSRAAT